ncbi:hypothetical protein NC653_000060 [Populus alba x Populus x berolinensis]|uniref:Toc75-like second POTRA domain-containing protein n=1 Tax=Populus alba x Populus x berolinensis TaxID=444605 RepID=A0AAD6RHS8_9ROSI|nr:hypothetical protein NC653_000060 [Populus alba x Populus x berolinensis]
MDPDMTDKEKMEIFIGVRRRDYRRMLEKARPCLVDAYAGA